MIQHRSSCYGKLVELAFIVGLVLGVGLSSVVWVWRLQRFESEVRRELPPGVGPPGESIRAALGAGVAASRAAEVRTELYRSLLGSVPVGCLLIDRENVLLDYNLQIGRWLGMHEPPTRRCLLIECVRSFELDELIHRARLTGATQEDNWFLSLADRNLAVRGIAVPLADGCIGLYLVDCSEIEHLVQQRDRWVGDVAHELKTPLTSIRLMSEMVQARVPAAQQQWLDRVLMEVQRLDLLIRDLLELSQWEAGSEELQPQPCVDLVDLIHQAWQTLEPVAQKRSIRMNVLGPEKLLVRADGERLYRAFLNLIDNAVRYSPGGEAFEVHLHSDAASVALDFIDRGPGFPKQDLGRVFERFYRADPARARQTGGTGLGLAIVREIVEAHQGTIQADNHPATGGAWLRIRLPFPRIEAPYAEIAAQANLLL